MLPNNRLVSQIQNTIATRIYNDTADYVARTQSGVDTYGQPTYSTTSTSVSCSFTDKVSREAWTEYADVESVEAEIRVASVTPTKGNYFTLTGRFGDSTFTDKSYEIIGIKDRGEFGFVCALKAVDL